MLRSNPDGCFVVQVGDSGQAAAEQISNRRDWDLVRFGTLDAARPFLTTGSKGTALVVCDAWQLKVRELLRLARDIALHSPQLSLGYLYGRGLLALSRAADRLITGPVPRSGKIRVFSMLGQHFPLAGARLLRIDSHALRGYGNEIISAPSPLDIFVGHSNGQDMGLGGRVLCRYSTDPALAADALDAMPCFHGGSCQREASGKGTPVFADAVGARRIINLSCWGVTLHNRPFAPALSVGEALLSGAGVAVMLATVRAVNLEASELQLLYHRCVGGLSFGGIANLANQFRLRTGAEAEWVCFGDPAEALDATALTAEAAWSGDTLSLSIPDQPINETRDLMVLLEPSHLPEQPILIQQTAGALLPAVVDPSGSLCLTVPAEWSAPEIRYRIVDRRSMDVAAVIAALVEGLDFLDCVIGGSKDPPLPDNVPPAEQAVRQIRRMLQGLAIALPIGEVVGDGWLDDAFTRVGAALHDLPEPMLDLCATFTRTFGLMQSKLWKWSFQYVGTNSEAVVCPTCGSAVDELVFESGLRRLRRRVGFCDACGFLYDGDPGVGRFIVLRDPVAPGTRMMVSMKLTNPYALDVPVSGYFVIDLHEFRTSEVVRFQPSMISAHAAKEISASIDIPEGLAPGTYFLGAMILVGTTLNAYQRTFRVSRR
jgi:hypothetical protein